MDLEALWAVEACARREAWVVEREAARARAWARGRGAGVGAGVATGVVERGGEVERAGRA